MKNGIIIGINEVVLSDKEKLMALQVIGLLESIRDKCNCCLDWTSPDVVILHTISDVNLYGEGFIIDRTNNPHFVVTRFEDETDKMDVPYNILHPLGLELTCLFTVFSSHKKLEKVLKRKQQPVFTSKNSCSIGNDVCLYRGNNEYNFYFRTWLEKKCKIDEREKLYNSVKDVFSMQFTPFLSTDGFTNLDDFTNGIKNFYNKKGLIKSFNKIVRNPRKKVFKRFGDWCHLFDAFGNELYRFRIECHTSQFEIHTSDFIHIYDMKNKFECRYCVEESDKDIIEFVDYLEKTKSEC